MGLGVEGAAPTPSPEKEQALCPCRIARKAAKGRRGSKSRREPWGHPEPEALAFLGAPTNLNNA